MVYTAHMDEVFDAAEKLRDVASTWGESTGGPDLVAACDELLAMREAVSFDLRDLRVVRFTVTAHAASFALRLSAVLTKASSPLEARTVETTGHVVGSVMFYGAIIAGKSLPRAIGDG